MLPEFGHFLLALASVAALAAALVQAWGLKRNHDFCMELWRVSAPLSALALTGAAAALVAAFVTDDFSVSYVANHSNTSLETIYKVAAFWGSHEGSMLLWVVLISWAGLLTGLFCWRMTEAQDRAFAARIQMVMLAVAGLFGLFLLLTSNPFARNLPVVPAQGHDLNPILQDIGMILHPPVLFAGYAGLTLCFAVAVAVLATGQWTQRATAISKTASVTTWIYLTAGNALGSWWAYTELGWGGWWFWDPVENASFIPWLGTTALLHTLLTVRMRGQGKRLCLALMIGCFALCLLGTFIVRSGAMASVHAFASDPNRGIAIAVVAALMIVPACVLYARRVDQVAGTTGNVQGEDILMTAGVYLLVASSVAVLIGTIYPLIHEALGLGLLTVGAPYFNSFFAPMTILASVLMGLVHVLRVPRPMWRYACLIVCALVSLAAGWAIAQSTHPKDAIMTAAGLSGALWIVTTLLAGRLSGRSRVSMTTVLAHAAVAVAMVGATGASQYEQEALVRMEPGSGRPLDDVVFVHTDTFKVNTRTYFGDAARIEVLDAADESVKTVLLPMRQTFVSTGMQMSSAGIEHGLWRDFYVSMGNRLSETEWLVRVAIKPMVSWLWAGAFLMMLSGVWLLLRRRKPV